MLNNPVLAVVCEFKIELTEIVIFYPLDSAKVFKLFNVIILLEVTVHCADEFTANGLFENDKTNVQIPLPVDNCVGSTIVVLLPTAKLFDRTNEKV